MNHRSGSGVGAALRRKTAQIGSIFPGPYGVPLFRCRTVSACTNKPPILPYRGVARTGVCFAMETTLDAPARRLGLSAAAIRLANLVPADAMPYRNVVGKVFDSGDYPEALRRAVAAVDVAAIRARQAAGERVMLIGAGLLQADRAGVALSGGAVVRTDTGAGVSIAEVARTWYRKPQNLPLGVDSGGLEVTAGYRPSPDTGHPLLRLPRRRGPGGYGHGHRGAGGLRDRGG